MKNYYCVTSSFDNRGRVAAAITKCVKAEEQPENTFKDTPTKDIYNEWFASIKAAERYVREAKSA